VINWLISQYNNYLSKTDAFVDFMYTRILIFKLSFIDDYDFLFYRIDVAADDMHALSLLINIPLYFLYRFKIVVI